MLILKKDNKLLINQKLLQQYNNGIPKIANLLNDGSNKPSKFRTRNWVEINDEARGTSTINKLNLKHQC